MKKILLLPLLVCWAFVSTPATAQQTKQLEFDHIFNGIFEPETVRNINWMRDGQYYTTLVRTERDLELRKYDITTGEHEVIVRSSKLKVKDRKQPIIIQDYQFSSDETKLLVKTDIEQIWRRSTKENYFVYDLETEEVQKLTDSEKKQQYAQLSPKGDRAAYVIDNNLYWVQLNTGEQTQITTDGEVGEIINGTTDWVYEEEFGFAKAWYWSPDGSKIAFYRFDESHVKEFSMMDWGKLYPGFTQFKFPKAGERNSIVKIGVYDLDTGETTWMDIGSENDQYIPRINWTQNSRMLAIRRMNRLQNKQDLMLADTESGDTEIIKTETSDTWIDVNNDLTFLENEDQFIYVSEESGYNHIYLYDLNGEEIRQITTGDWEVTNFIGYNETNERLYYISTEESPLERDFYSIGLDGNNKQKMSDGPGWTSVNMSHDYKYYIEITSGPATPARYKLHKGNGEQVRVLQDNASLSQLVEEYNMPEKEFFTIPLPQAELNAYILKPHDFDASKKYPVLVYVYGGPGSQTVEKKFGTGHRPMWHRYLTSKGYIVLSIDNRGTGGRGRDFEKQIYKKLGQYEVTDQIDAVKYVIENYDYVDADRIGVWGWSYGGYMSTMLMEQGNDLFKAGIAVAPVTHWRFYDTIYTERFMQTPEMNPEGYHRGSPLYDVENIKGKYLLVHGTGDDNVHFQNSVELVNQLIEEGIQFETMYYPDRNHSIYGGNTRRHLYQMMTNFILEEL